MKWSDYAVMAAALISIREIKTAPPGVTVVHGLLPVDAERTSPLETPAPHPLQILVAVDGSPCSDRAVQSVAMRPWPTGSEVEVVSVPHTRMPGTPDAPLLMLEAAHVDALEAERLRATRRIPDLEACIARAERHVRVLRGQAWQICLLLQSDRR